MTKNIPEDLEAALRKTIMEGDAAGAEALSRRALEDGISPVNIIEIGLLPALKRMGELFEAGDVFLPELMMAGEAMKAAVRILGPAIRASGGKADKRPIIILGTVEGDIHEIGKNIVAIMLETAGFEVVDLGMNVKADAFVKAAKEHDASIIGASALLTTTMEHQKDIVEQARAAKLKAMVIVGGAPVDQAWADSIGADGYAETAKDAVDLVVRLLKGGGAT
jgi:5-methyltetrahydrofolate--homocysteine methyltransferase